MASMLYAAKDFVSSKVTPDCLKGVKASADELKEFAKAKTGAEPGGPNDPDNPANKGKITEWEAAWNVTNAIQVHSRGGEAGSLQR